MIDLTPLLGYLVEIAVAVLSTAGAYFVHRLAKRLDMDMDDGAAAAVERYIEMAVESVAGKIDPQIDATDNATVRDIVQWVGGHAPKAMRRAGLSADDIEGMVRRRLNG